MREKKQKEGHTHTHEHKHIKKHTYSTCERGNIYIIINNITIKKTRKKRNHYLFKMTMRIQAFSVLFRSFHFFIEIDEWGV